MTCLSQDSLHDAAQKLWERDCGSLPVVDADNRPLAMITDRDVCMAAWSTGRSLFDLQVTQAMSKQLVACREQDDLDTAAARLAQNGVRRMPVCDETGKIVGILSLNDFANAVANERVPRLPESAYEALRVLVAVSAHRQDDAKNEPAPARTQSTASPSSAQPAAQPQTQLGRETALPRPSTPPRENTASANA